MDFQCFVCKRIRKLTVWTKVFAGGSPVSRPCSPTCLETAAAMTLEP